MISIKIKIRKQKSLVDNDFSAQEPRIMSSLCGERELIDGYNLRSKEFPKGRDFYAILASSAFGKDYWECTEFDQNGNFNQEGKNRRQAGKVIQLGVSYGMGAELLVKGLNAKKKPGEPKMTVEEGRKMMDDFFGKFKTLKAWKDYCMARLDQFGYMESAMGRRRRLYDVWLPDYNVTAYTPVNIEDIFFDRPPVFKARDLKREKEIIQRLDSEENRFRKKDLVETFKMDPLVKITSNGGYKSRPKTQATNYCIQSGGAELTKKAMVALYNHPDKERLGIQIVAPVHDEILIEAYTSERKEALKTLAGCMAGTAEGVYEVKMAGDGLIETSWNFEHFVDKLQKEYKKNGGDIQQIYNNYQEIDQSVLDKIVSGEIDVEVDYIKPRKNLLL